jgi:hypothetical protein
MKNSLFIFVCVFSIACTKGSSSPNNSTTQTSITGQWNYLYNVDFRHMADGTPVDNDTDFNESHAGEYAIYTADSKIMECWWSSQNGFYYDTLSYQITKDSLTIYTPGYAPQGYTIKTLNAHTLTYYIPDADLNPNGIYTDYYVYYSR